ncbi:MAG: hypothetical protein EA350_02220 [Gemmatimonadales bacterium]|nr:MAG: hypothetical protein EA350_02220 [Gemmatimonadales bacterium]
MDQPRRVEVEVDTDGCPVAVRGRRGRVQILAVRESWRIDDEWWRAPISRHYFEVILESGRPLLLYRDRVEKRWYFQ